MLHTQGLDKIVLDRDYILYKLILQDDSSYVLEKFEDVFIKMQIKARI